MRISRLRSVSLLGYILMIRQAGMRSRSCVVRKCLNPSLQNSCLSQGLVLPTIQLYLQAILELPDLERHRCIATPPKRLARRLD